MKRSTKISQNRIDNAINSIADSREDASNCLTNAGKNLLESSGNLFEVTLKDSDYHVKKTRDNLHRAFEHAGDSIPSTLEDRRKDLAETLPNCAQNLSNALEVETKLVYALNDSLTEGIERLDKPVPRLNETVSELLVGVPKSCKGTSEKAYRRDDSRNRACD